MIAPHVDNPDSPLPQLILNGHHIPSASKADRVHGSRVQP